jgi:5-methylcytosine-specific restriction protein A
MPNRRADQRSKEALAYRRWYKTARWQRLRAQVLRAQPLCVMCRESGILTPATVCDHIEPHKGDEHKFWNGPFAGLCAPCHNSTKARIEAGTGPQAIGPDGWPLER